MEEVKEMQMSNTFKNKHFTKRDYEATNIVACEIVDEGGAIRPEWTGFYVSASESVLDGLTPLWIESGVRYWGYL